MDDFTGAPEMPRLPGIVAQEALRQPRADLPPIELVHDTHRDEWTIIVNDGAGGQRSAVLPREVVRQLAEAVTPSQPPAPSGIQAQVTFVEYANLGDSAAYIRHPASYDPQETIQALLDRSLEHIYRHHDPGNRIELQIIPETIPKPQPDPDPWGDPDRA